MTLPTPLLAIPASADLSAEDGFYAAEGSPDEPFRWTGPATSFVFRFEVDRAAPLVARLECFGEQGRHNLRNMFCEFDGVLRPAFYSRSVGVHLVLCRLHPRLRPGRTELCFHTQYTQPPSADDPRRLGIMFTRLLLLPVAATTVSG